MSDPPIIPALQRLLAHRPDDLTIRDVLSALDAIDSAGYQITGSLAHRMLDILCIRLIAMGIE